GRAGPGAGSATWATASPCAWPWPCHPPTTITARASSAVTSTTARGNGARRGQAVTDRNVAFVGDIPQNYDRYLGPVLFHPYADDLAERVQLTAGVRRLENACGTRAPARRPAPRPPAPPSPPATRLT